MPGGALRYARRRPSTRVAMKARAIALLVPTLGALACVNAAPAPDEELPRAGPGALYAIGASLGDEIASYELDEDEAREVARGVADAAQRKPYAAPHTPETAGLVSEFHEHRLQALARREEQAGAPLLEAALREPGAVKTD